VQVRFDDFTARLPPGVGEVPEWLLQLFYSADGRTLPFR
jgi:hypothetical protein